MIRISKNQSVAIMTDGSILFPEEKKDWEELKVSKQIHTLFTSSSSIIESIKKGDKWDDLEEAIEEIQNRYTPEKEKEGLI